MGDKHAHASSERPRQTPQEFEQDPSGSILETLAHEAPLCASERLMRQPRNLTDELIQQQFCRPGQGIATASFESPVLRARSSELFRQIGKKETGNAILVGALLFIQHPGIVAAQERGLLFGLGSRDEKSVRDAGQIRTVGGFNE
jgi:hypothetical protein